ncbi:MAG: 2-C-methyl-D-erythritol 2,4-cyclodiphosphate synthase [Elusimicrobiota bacterium]
MKKNIKKSVKKNAPKKNMFDFRIGFGYDIHRMTEGRDLILGGYKINYPKGMLGHSDGDLIIHSVCDAILGALNEGEIGVYFPPTDLTLMGISSGVIAEKVLEILKKRRAFINQIDVTLVAEEPKIKPYYEPIKKSLAKVFKIDENRVSFKAKSMEGLGEVGRGEAMICYAVAGVILK